LSIWNPASGADVREASLKNMIFGVFVDFFVISLIFT